MRNNNREVIKKEDKTFKKIEYTYTFKVNRSDILLDFLLSKIPNSRNSIKSLLSSNKVLVNGSVTRQYNYPLCKDDEVKIAKNPIRDDLTKSKTEPVKTNPLKNRVIFENETYIAIDKPNGLLSVESDKERESAYLYMCDLMKTKDKTVRPFLLHRIDKETSGVLVFSKDIKLHSMLKMHWNEDIKEREYYCVVNGVLTEKTGTIESYLMENSNNLVYSTKNPRGKKAITHYEVIKENKMYSLLRVVIDTGRKNQIRVHMNDIGHPILGDEKYQYIESPINRLCLHASSLKFLDPVSKKELTIKAKVPDDFYSIVK